MNDFQIISLIITILLFITLVVLELIFFLRKRTVQYLTVEGLPDTTKEPRKLKNKAEMGIIFIILYPLIHYLGIFGAWQPQNSLAALPMLKAAFITYAIFMPTLIIFVFIGIFNQTYDYLRKLIVKITKKKIAMEDQPYFKDNDRTFVPTPKTIAGFIQAVNEDWKEVEYTTEGEEPKVEFKDLKGKTTTYEMIVAKNVTEVTYVKEKPTNTSWWKRPFTQKGYKKVITPYKYDGSKIFSTIVNAETEEDRETALSLLTTIDKQKTDFDNLSKDYNDIFWVVDELALKKHSEFLARIRTAKDYTEIKDRLEKEAKEKLHSKEKEQTSQEETKK